MMVKNACTLNESWEAQDDDEERVNSMRFKVGRSVDEDHTRQISLFCYNILCVVMNTFLH